MRFELQLLAVVYTDTVVYRLLRYHFLSSAVVNVAFTEGSGDSIILGAYVWATAAGVIDSRSTPSPISAIASSGRPPISPHTASGFPAARTGSMTRFRKSRMAGLSQS